MEQPYDTSNNTVSDKELVAWPRVAMVAAMVSFSIPTVITGIELFSNMSWPDAFIALMIGAILLTFIGGFMGWVGAYTRKNAYMLVRIGFGDQGARILNLLFSLSLVGWFGVNLDLFSASVIKVSLITLGLSPPAYFIEAIAGLLMIATTLYGFSAINKLSIALVPIMVMMSLVMLWGAAEKLSIDALLTHEIDNNLSISGGVSLIVGVIIIGAIILPDITRFSRQTRGGIYTAFWAYFITQSLVILIASYATLAFGFTDILDILLALGIGVGALFVVIAGSWILNSLNLYSAELAASESISGFSQRAMVLCLGALGTIAAFANILDYFILFLSLLTAVFVPVAGIIAVDFLFINKTKYASNRVTLQSHWPALIAWFVGALLIVVSQFYQVPSVTQVTAIDGILLSALLFLLLNRMFLPVTQSHSK